MLILLVFTNYFNLKSFRFILLKESLECIVVKINLDIGINKDFEPKHIKRIADRVSTRDLLFRNIGTESHVLLEGASPKGFKQKILNYYGTFCKEIEYIF